MIKWEIDENGYLTTDCDFISMKHVMAILKREDNELHIILCNGAGIKTIFNDKDNEIAKDSRDKMVEMLKKWLTEYSVLSREKNEADENYKQAILATQKRIIHEHIGI